METQLERRKKAEDDFTQCPRYDKHELSENQIKSIAEAAAIRAVEIARENFYKDVGQSVVSKWFIFVGIATVGLYAWLRGKNII